MSSNQDPPPPRATNGENHTSLKALFKATVQGVFEGLWGSAFWLSGRLRRPSAELWNSPGGQRVLVVAAHPDDEIAGCSGVILRHLRCGDQVRILCVTDGGRSGALGLHPEQMGAVRRGEMEAAAEALGAELEWIGLMEGDWLPDDLMRRLGDTLDRLRPHAVYAPSRVDFHPEHLAVARELARALALAPRATGTVIRVYPIQVPLTANLCNLVAPVDPSAQRLHDAFAAHRSQLGSLRSCLRLRRYAARFHGFAGWAEEFWQLAPSTYARLHRNLPLRSCGRTFRGLRPWAFSDPLAYLHGRRDRRRLARLVAKADSAS